MSADMGRAPYMYLLQDKRHRADAMSRNRQQPTPCVCKHQAALCLAIGKMGAPVCGIMYYLSRRRQWDFFAHVDNVALHGHGPVALTQLVELTQQVLSGRAQAGQYRVSIYRLYAETLPLRHKALGS